MLSFLPRKLIETNNRKSFLKMHLLN